MEIVIENPTEVTAASNPTMTMHHHHPATTLLRQPTRGIYGAESPLSSATDYFGRMNRGNLVVGGAGGGGLDGASTTSVRRVDKSGLLEIPDLDPAAAAAALCRPRLLTGAESVSSHMGGTLSRRVDRSGLLEAVPEVPDQQRNQRTSEDTAAVTASATCSADADARGRILPKRQLTGGEMQAEEQRCTGSLSPRLTTGSSSPGEVPASTAGQRRCLNDSSHGSADSGQQNVRGVPGTSTRVAPPSSPNLYFRVHASPRANSASLMSPPLQVPACGETHSAKSQLHSANNQMTRLENPVDRATDATERLGTCQRSDRRSPVALSAAIPDVIDTRGSTMNATSGTVPSELPEGERAEAEGCEHTAIESLEETRVSFKAPNKLLNNDNIQTLRVIILSEQL